MFFFEEKYGVRPGASELLFPHIYSIDFEMQVV